MLAYERAWSLRPEGEEGAIEAVTVRGALPQVVGHDAVWVGVVGPEKKIGVEFKEKCLVCNRLT